MKKEASNSAFTAPALNYESSVERLKRYFGDWYVYDDLGSASVKEEKYRKSAIAAKDICSKALPLDEWLRASFAVRIHELLKKGETAEQIIGQLTYPKFVESKMPQIKAIVGKEYADTIRDEFWFLED